MDPTKESSLFSIRYSSPPVNIFSVMSGLNNNFLGINQYSATGVMPLAQGHKKAPSEGIKPRTFQFRVRCSTTWPPCSLMSRDNSGLQTQWAFLTNFINIFGPKQQLPIELHFEKGSYLSIEGAFLKNYGPFSTGTLPELSLMSESKIILRGIRTIFFLSFFFSNFLDNKFL